MRWIRSCEISRKRRQVFTCGFLRARNNGQSIKKTYYLILRCIIRICAAKNERVEGKIIYIYVLDKHLYTVYNFATRAVYISFLSLATICLSLTYECPIAFNYMQIRSREIKGMVLCKNSTFRYLKPVWNISNRMLDKMSRSRSPFSITNGKIIFGRNK